VQGVGSQGIPREKGAEGLWDIHIGLGDVRDKRKIRANKQYINKKRAKADEHWPRENLQED